MRNINKYNNKKTIVDGVTFDSKKEAQRYCELKILERAGTISNLELQPRFLLIKAFTNNKGKKIRKTEYVGDFKYQENGKTVVEDVKGFKTKEYKLKAKLLQYLYRCIDFREV